MNSTIDLGDILTHGHDSLRLPRMSFDEFWSLCRQNPGLQVELSSEGDLVFMSPTGGRTGNRNATILRQLGDWADQNGAGLIFDSSTLFRLPNGAVRSPDAAWVRFDRWNELTEIEQDEPTPFAPDFVIELMSPSDRLPDADRKLQEFAANGVRLGWLIDPKSRQVRIYRPSQAVTLLQAPTEVIGDPELPGFVLSLSRIF